MAEALAVSLLTQRCEGCGSELAPRLLTCPSCRKLVHGKRLTQLATDAQAASERGAPMEALALWREALDLLPPGTAQHAQVTARVTALSQQADAQGLAAPLAEAERKRSGMPKVLASMGAVGLMLWKFKFVLALLLGKGKLLLLGLTKASTLFSMLFAVSVYWTMWGWSFALGLVACIYVHEMGHVASLRRLGMKADAPMFIPGLGAFVRLKQVPVDEREDARVGLAGPIWGSAAAVVVMVAAVLTGWKALGAIAHAAAWLNLFNLVPVWQLDGSRGFRALARQQRWIAVAVLGATWFATGENLLLLIAGVAAFRALLTPASETGDRRTLVEYCALVVGLGALGWVAQHWTGAAVAL
ncbi:site-2 protease family protein [Corallococcus sp. AB011P]|uniref:site-2 protease family protein n=1 Tax=Corallococcus sp. AB011P TaxID=2316735 RepID=UPI000EA0F478|nr:site-2 protease family protein [Corallococcus sp. AB011P]RKG56180.1 site-2 protease family protein [Corallococcus sp. AB011P]